MGWTFSHRAKGQSDLDYFTRSGTLTWSAPGYQDYRVVASATVDRAVFYAVLEMDAHRQPSLVPDENGKVRLALVLLIKWVPRDYHNFGYKDMDEFMGPCEATCPEKILDLLSPIRAEVLSASYAKRAADLASGKSAWACGDGIISAAEWRERCRALIAVRRAVRQPGTKLRLSERFKFRDGVAATDLTVGELHRTRPTFIRQDGLRFMLKRTDYGLLSLA